MTNEIVGAAIAAVIHLLLGIIVWTRDRTNRINLSFLGLSFALAVWNIGFFLSSAHLSASENWRLLMHIGICFIPSTAFHFVHNFIGLSRTRNIREYFLPMLYALSFIFSILGFTSFLNSEYWRYLMFIFVFPVLIYLLRLIYVKRERARSLLEKTKLNYLLSAAIIATIAGMFNFIPAAKSIANTVSIFFSYIIAIAIIRHQLLDIRLAIRRTLALTALLIIMTIFIISVYLLLNPHTTNLSYPIFLTIVLSFLMIFEPLKGRLETLSEALANPKLLKHRRILTQFNNAVENISTQEELGSAFLEAVKTALSPSQASFIVYDPYGKKYRLAGTYGPQSSQVQEYLEMLPPDGLPPDLTNVIEREVARQKAWDLSKDNSCRQDFEKIYMFMSRCNLEVVVPQICRGKFLGLLTLGKNDQKDIYSRYDFDFLKILSGHEADTLSNLRVLERIRTADRLAALGELSASIAHEIRNPLGSMKGAAQILQDKFDKNDSDRQLMDIIVSETNRLNTLVNSFLEFAKPTSSNLKPTNPVELINKIIDMIREQEKYRKIIFEISAKQDNLSMVADSEKVQQIILNLVGNSADAMDYDGKISINIYPSKKLPNYIDIELCDSGPGIPSENRERIFDPFFTTKKNGTGLGLPISHQLATIQGGFLIMTKNNNDHDVFILRLKQTETNES